MERCYFHFLLNKTKHLIEVGPFTLSRLPSDADSTFIRVNRFTHCAHADTLVVKLEYAQTVTYVVQYMGGGFYCFTFARDEPKTAELDGFLKYPCPHPGSCAGWPTSTRPSRSTASRPGWRSTGPRCPRPAPSTRATPSRTPSTRAASSSRRGSCAWARPSAAASSGPPTTSKAASKTKAPWTSAGPRPSSGPSSRAWARPSA